MGSVPTISASKVWVVGCGDKDEVGFADHVAVGDNQAVFTDDYTGAGVVGLGPGVEELAQVDGAGEYGHDGRQRALRHLGDGHGPDGGGRGRGLGGRKGGLGVRAASSCHEGQEEDEGREQADARAQSVGPQPLSCVLV